MTDQPRDPFGGSAGGDEPTRSDIPPSAPPSPGYGTSQPPSQQQSQSGSAAYRPPPPPASQASGDAGSFFQALVDVSFKRYVTPTIVKVVYILLMVGVVVYYLVIAAATFSRSATFGVLWLLILGPLFAVIVLAGYRMLLELFVAVVRIAQDVEHIKDRGTVS